MRLWVDDPMPPMPRWWRWLTRQIDKRIDRFWDRVYGPMP